MLTFLASRLRDRLDGKGRQRVKAILNPLCAPIGSIQRTSKAIDAVAITFDDGPDPDITPRILDMLRSHRARATFFMLSEKAKDQGDLVRRAVDEGHEIGLHADRHDRLTRLPTHEVRGRLKVARKDLERQTGRPVRYFRPPFGAQSLTTFLAARSLGMDVVCWGPYAADWEEQTPENAAARALDGTKGGDIILLHDGLEVPDGEVPPTFDRLPMLEILLDGLARRRLKAHTVSELIAAGGARRTAWFRA